MRKCSMVRCLTLVVTCIASCIASSYGAIAAADTAASATASAQATPATTSDATQQNGTVEGSLTQIVVTATKVAQPLNKVPISISAYSRGSLDIAGVKTMDDIAALTPGVTFTENAGADAVGTAISIRGINQTANTAATTGVYIDDTPVSVRQTNNSDAGDPYPLIFDLDRVEVLRGPQGTLFGAGAEGGVVQFITNKPSLTTYSEYERAEVADTDGGAPSYEAGMAVGGPIEDNVLGFRVDAWGRHDGGWVDDQNYETGVVDKNDNWSDSAALRLALTYAPTSSVQITPSIYYQDVHRNDTSVYWLPLSDPSANKYVDGDVLEAPGSDRFVLPSLKVTADLSNVDIDSITSVFYRRDTVLTDGTTFESEVWALTPYPILPGQNAPDYTAEIQNVFSQEIRFSSAKSDSPLSWVGGLFFSDSRVSDNVQVEDLYMPQLIELTFHQTEEQFFGVPLLDNKFDLYSWDDSYERDAAAYGHLNYNILHNLTLGVGVRVAQTKFHYAELDAGPVYGPAHTLVGNKSATPVTPAVNLNYQVTPDDMVYGTVSEGYRVGGVNPAIPPSPPCSAALAQFGLTSAPTTFNSDTLWNYEVGAKDSILGGRVQTDLSVFYDQWRNIQQFVTMPTCAGLGFIGNLGTAVSQGFDLAAQVHVAGGLHVGLALGFNNAYYTKNLGAAPAVIVSRGDTLGNAPWIVTVSPEYDVFVGDRTIYFRAQDEYHSHNGGNWPGNNPESVSYDPAIPLTPASNLLDLRAGLEWSGYNVSLFVNNALNTHPNLQLSHNLPGDPLYFGYTFRPLTVGLTMTYNH
jgi:iron complex outermembrane recepter protein